MTCKRLVGCRAQITARQEDEEYSAAVIEERRALGNVIDRLMFYISLIILASLCIWMMVNSSRSHAAHELPQTEESTTDGDHH